MGIEQEGLTPVSAVSEAAALTEEGRVRERNFDILTTHIDGFFLLVDHGTEPDLTRSQTRALKETSNVYGVRSEVIKRLLELQEVPHSELVDIGINNPGLRGGRDIVTGVELQINPKTVDIFDESLLDASLGERRSEVAHKKVSVTVELDPDRDDVDGFITSISRRLRRQGFSKEEIEKRLKVKRTLRVDEETLLSLIDAGDVTLMPGAWNIQTKNWDIVPRKIPTRQELAEAEENARNSQ
ncbi:MAG: hypothetical protein A2171_00320 [Candidatus Levybacteria bacterium RBG_13_35_9]|nr:MAG: hypothetical protein A2171_00320 [Candidatus Levybacteria bacterium RBG_13_35_9]